MSLQLKWSNTRNEASQLLVPKKNSSILGKNIAAMKILVAGISIIVYKSAKKMCKFYFSFCKKAISHMFQNFKFIMRQIATSH